MYQLFKNLKNCNIVHTAICLALFSHLTTVFPITEFFSVKVNF